MDAATKPRAFGVTGSLLGLLALIVTVTHFYMGPIAEPEPAESVIAETAVNIKNAVAAKLKGEEYVAPKREAAFDLDRVIDQGAMIAALVALSLGVFGFLRREEYLPSGLALGLGGAAVVFSVSIAIAGLIVGALILAAIIGALGLDFGA